MREVHGVEVGGSEADELLLSDGTKLILEADGEDPRPWHRVGDGTDENLTIDNACEVAGEEFEGYVRARTFSEASWLSMLGAWANERAAMLVSEGEPRLQS